MKPPVPVEEVGLIPNTLGLPVVVPVPVPVGVPVTVPGVVLVGVVGVMVEGDVPGVFVVGVGVVVVPVLLELEGKTHVDDAVGGAVGLVMAAPAKSQLP